ncbi:MAG: AAA family ATPase [Planctomycetia bacterium]|nr:AAA family ATPase [Planctomycetia bacterium]
MTHTAYPNPDSERDFLCGLLELFADNSPKAREALERVAIDAFTTQEHRWLVEAIGKTLSDHDRPQIADLANTIRENSRDVKQSEHAPEYDLMVDLLKLLATQKQPFHVAIERRAEDVMHAHKQRVSVMAGNDLVVALARDDVDGIAAAQLAISDALSDAPARSRAAPAMTCLADVEPCEVDWLWPGRFPLGRISLLVGRPGEGKSFLTTDMASRVSTGTPWPDGTDCPRGSVVLIAAEDDPGDTIRPRLDAHYADVRRIHLLTGVRSTGKRHERMISLADVETVRQSLEMHPDCKLIIVDPIGSFLGGGVDAHRDNEVRSVLAPIAQLAKEHNVAVVVVAHRRKSVGSNADEMCLGSIAFAGIARAVWHLSRDTEDKARRLLLPGKNNLGREVSGLAFSIIGEPARISWESDPVEMTADDQLVSEKQGREQKRGPDGEATRDAENWLRSILADGPRLAKELNDEWVNGMGGGKRTLERAKVAACVEAFRETVPGGWHWRLPENNLAVLAQGKQLGGLGGLAKNAGNTHSFNGDFPKAAKLFSLGGLEPSEGSQWLADSF